MGHVALPFAQISRPGIVGHRRPEQILLDAALGHQQLNILLAQCQIQLRVEKPVFATAAQRTLLGDVTRGARHQLHQPARTGVAFGAAVKARFLAHKREDQGLVDRIG